MAIFEHFAKAIERQYGHKWPILGTDINVCKFWFTLRRNRNHNGNVKSLKTQFESKIIIVAKHCQCRNFASSVGEFQTSQIQVR